MAVSLRRMFTVLLCVGIALGAADAQGLICEYICASGSVDFHGHEAEAQNASHRVVRHGAKEPGDHHEASLFSFESSHDDSDCASLTKLVIANSDTPTSAGSRAQSVIVIEPVVRTTLDDPYLAAGVNGSPPQRATVLHLATSVSLRI